MKLTPFVTKTMPTTKSRYNKGKAETQFQGGDYLDLWAADNEEEVSAIKRSIEQRKLKEEKKKKPNKKSRRARGNKR